MILNENLKVISDDVERVCTDIHKLTPFDLMMKHFGKDLELMKELSEGDDVFGDWTPDIPEQIYHSTMEQSAEALYEEGVSAYNGHIVEDQITGRDRERAIVYFAMAGSKRHAMAAFNAGYMFLNGEGTETDYGEAFYWFVMAANLGNERGYYFLGDFYMTGRGVVGEDHKLAAYFYKISADMGSPAGKFNYAAVCMNGDGVEQNVEEGLKYLKESAEMGFALAMKLADQLGIDYDTEPDTCDVYIDFLRKEVEFFQSAAHSNVFQSVLPDLEKSRNVTDMLNILSRKRREFYDRYVVCKENDLRKKFATYHNVCRQFFQNLHIYSDKTDPITYAKENLTDDADHNVNILLPLYRIKRAEIGAFDKARFDLITLWKNRAIQALRLKEFGLVSDEFDGKRYILENEYAGLDFYDETDTYKAAFEMIADGTADAEITAHIADMLFEGLFSRPMTVYAHKYYEIAANMGNVDAMFNLGMCYRWGEGGVYVDIEKAMHWFKKAALEGHENARDIVEKFDNEEGRTILELSVVHGADGAGSKWYKHKTFVDQYYEMADSGDVEAQYELARQLVPENEFGAFKRLAPKAAYYYELAAKQGSKDAAFNLANLYQTGSVDFDSDTEQEFKWRKVCADLGDGEACYMIGQMYLEGRGTEMNEKMGRKYIKKASALGYTRQI
ncbi:MAG: SEL1-like repeat protein [Lachnospiraceae bacterium]|nr:SEL1-like repeat protein [Lachnospiraceae bacterium]